MVIGVLSEISTCQRNSAVCAALENRGHTIVNMGMKGPEEEVVLSYVHTAFMAAFLLHLDAVDLVVSGCGTGQGFAIAANQQPGIFCGLIRDPLEAWLFRQINAGNCISLALNMGYGWAGDENLRFVFDAYFSVPNGGGYPPQRKEFQTQARNKLSNAARVTRRDMLSVIEKTDKAFLRECAGNKAFLDLVTRASSESAAKSAFLNVL